MRKNTIFTTPVVKSIARLIAIGLLRMRGWTVVGDKPENSDKLVIICIPHTSNWDFPIMLGAAFEKGLAVNWTGKNSLFPPVLGAMMRWLGGISINRSQSTNIVDQIAEAFAERDSLHLIITPEGTRSSVDKWKSGFYHIAVAANVPIVFAALHAPDKVINFGTVFHPTGDYDKDIVEIRAYFKDCVGIVAENT